MRLTGVRQHWTLEADVPLGPLMQVTAHSATLDTDEVWPNSRDKSTVLHTMLSLVFLTLLICY